VKQVKGMKKRVVTKGAKIIVAVPDIWLRLPIMDMLLLFGEGSICINSLDELFEKVKEYPKSILVIDILAFKDSNRDTLVHLINQCPFLSIVVLLNKDEFSYTQYYESACLVVEKEKADRMLIPAINKAQQNQKIRTHSYTQEQKQLPILNKKEVNVMGKENGSILGNKFGRRSFLKGSVAAAALTGVAVASPGNTVLQALAAGSGSETNIPEEKVFACVCRGNCTGACQINVHVRDGKVVKTSKHEYKDPNYNRICQRGRSWPLRIYSPERIKHPMRRVGERGAGKWEQISWDEAISEICSKWKTLQQQYGKESIVFSTGGGNYAADVSNYPYRLKNYMGATFMAWCYDNALLNTEPGALGVGVYYGGNTHTDYKNSKNIFIWGANPSEAWHVYYHFTSEAQKTGTKLISIDPNFNIGAAKADKHVPIRPGTDALLAMAMTKIIIDNGWADLDFLKKSSVAPFLVKESDGKYLRSSEVGISATGEGGIKGGDLTIWGNALGASGGQGAIVVMGKDGKVGLPADIADPQLHGTYTINNIKVTTAYDLLIARLNQFSLEYVSKQCDIPQDRIVELAKIYIDGPSSIYVGYGPDHYANGHYAYYAMFALAMVAGSFGKPGTGLSGGFSINLGAGINTTPMDFPADHLSTAPTLPAPLMLDIVNQKKYGDIPINPRSLFVYGVNLLANQTERKSWIELFNKLDLVVVNEVVMSDTARYADIILPVADQFEVASQLSWLTPYIVLSEKAIDPLYECKGDLEIVNLLGKGMGLGDDFPITREEYLTRAYDNDQAKALNLSYERLKQEKQLRFFEGEYIHGAGGVFPTETGRAQFYRENAAPNYNYGQKFNFENERLPYWEPPHEAWHENELTKKYPLIFTTERNKFRAHTQFGHVQWLLEIWPEPFVRINPKDAADRGISDGDTVKVFNDRGYVVCKAVIHNGIRPGMTVMPKGWQQDQFIEGHYSDLTSRYSHPALVNNCWFDTLVEVKKV